MSPFNLSYSSIRVCVCMYVCVFLCVCVCDPKSFKEWISIKNNICKMFIGGMSMKHKEERDQRQVGRTFRSQTDFVKFCTINRLP